MISDRTGSRLKADVHPCIYADLNHDGNEQYTVDC